MNVTRCPNPNRPSTRLHAQATMTILLACAAFAALLVLAACGVSSAAAPSGAQPQHTSSGPGTPYNPFASVRPCSGPYANAGDSATALVLTLQTANQSGSVRVGQVAQVQLPISHQWSLITVPKGLQLVGAAAQQDTQRNVCFWDFQVTTAGTYVIGFIGITQCDPKAAICQQSTVTQRFTLKAS